MTTKKKIGPFPKDIQSDHKNRRINVEISQTHNIGNYESVKITTGLSVDIPNHHDIDDAYDKVAGEVINQLMVLKEQIIP